MTKILKIIWLILFILAISFSMWTVTYCLQYDVLTIHDLAYPYGRKFLEPDHGRYLAYFTSNVLVEILPEIFNIHPNDFSPKFISVIKGFIVILSCLIITNACFLFTKEKDKTVFKVPIFNPVFTLLYMLIFLALFNDNFFFNDNSNMGLNYFAVFENIIFFEYPSSIILYTVVISIFGYYFINNKIPDNRTFNIFLVLLFLLGITVEAINFPVFVGFILFIPYLLFNKTQLKDKKKYIILISIVYLISLLAYYIRPNGHIPQYNGTFLHYLKTAIIPFLITYRNDIIIKYSILLIPIGLLFIPALYIDKEKAKRLIYFVFANIIGFWCFYAVMFFAGYMFDNAYYIEPKWTNLYRVITLFYLVLTFGFVIDFKFKKASNIIKFFVCICIFCIFNKNLITDYIPNMNNIISKEKEIRTAAYMTEKIALYSRSDIHFLLIPKKLAKYGTLFWYDDYECGYPKYLNNVYPKIYVNKIIYTEDNKFFDSHIFFDDNELEELKFSHLLKERMYRHKKVFNNCK